MAHGIRLRRPRPKNAVLGVLAFHVADMAGELALELRDRQPRLASDEHFYPAQLAEADLRCLGMQFTYPRTHVTLRILQLTDLHLGPRLSDGRWAALEKFLAHLPLHVGDFDRVVLTGDLASHGQRVVYEALRARLGALLPQVLIVPGNHDNSRLVHEVFGDRMQDGAPAANFLDDVDGVRLVGLDSSRPWRVSGALGQPQLLWLSRVLDPPCPTLVFLHHPPVRVGTWWLDKDRLRDHDALLQAVQHRSVLGIFCGHVHHESEGKLGTIPVWTTPSTAYQFKPRTLVPRTEVKAAAFRLIEMSAGRVETSILAIEA